MEKALCLLDWIDNQYFNSSLFAHTFKRAGDEIISSLEINNALNHPDELFMPIMYLYRHSLENKLKYLIKLSVELKLIESPSADRMNTHNLAYLWELVRECLILAYPNDDKTLLNEVRRLIYFFQKLDKTGQNLRYSHDTKGKKTIENYPKLIDLKLLSDRVNEIYEFLDDCEAGLEVMLELNG